MYEEKIKISNQDFEKQRVYLNLVNNINKAYFKKTGKNKNAFVHTYGCQQNVADSEKIKGLLKQMGYTLIENIEHADFILYNTCAVRENAENRVFGNTGKLKQLKKEKPNLIIALSGCMTQQEHVVNKLKISYPYVNLIMGAHSLHLLPKLLYNVITTQKKIIDIENREGIFPEGLPISRENKTQASVPIMYGCDNFCTYCIVPYVRGREYSRNFYDIKEECKNLIADGYKEILLLGQNVNSYGKGLDYKINFAQLLKELNTLDGDFKISFMTSHPKDCSKELIDVIANSQKISKHLHLPVQSGSNKILKLMNRKYTAEEYKHLIDYAKNKIDGLILSTDIIVGFPGESYEDFLKTKEIIEYVKFNFLYTFIYSKRQGTIAATLPDQISIKEKHKWFSELLALQEKINKK